MRKLIFSLLSVSKNVCEIFLFLISLFFKDVPQSLSLDRFLFCCCDDSTGLARCLQDFANVLSIANLFAMFAKMFAWFRNLILRSWVAGFYVAIFILKLRKCLRKCFIISQLCKNVCKNYKSVQKCLQKKFFFFVGGVKIILFSRIVGKFIFVLYSHPLLVIGNRERRVALF